MNAEITINHKKLWKDLGWVVLFALLGAFNLGSSNVASALDFMLSGYCIGRTYQKIIVVEVTKK